MIHPLLRRLIIASVLGFFGLWLIRPHSILGHPMAVVPVPQAASQLVCTPALDFGQIQAGTAKTMTITCTNTGTTNVTISGATIAGKDFYLESQSPNPPTLVKVLVANGGTQ